MADEQQQDEANEPKFEQALSQLEAIVARLEDGSTGLADALTQYETGVGLLKQCYRQLERAERRIEQLSGVDAEGNAVTEPFDDDHELSLKEKAGARSKRRSKKAAPSDSAAKSSSKSSAKKRAAPPPIDESQGLF